MSFLDFRHIPGGAFMMCESISDFDESMPEVTPSVAEVNDAPVDAAAAPDSPMDQIRKKIAAGESIRDILEELRVIYLNQIVPLMNLDMNTAFDDRTVELAGRISETATLVFNYLLRAVNRVGPMFSYSNTYRSSHCVYGKVRDNLGSLVKNLPVIRREGEDHINLYRSYHPAFTFYDISSLASKLLCSMDLLKSQVINPDIIVTFTYVDNPLVTLFSDMNDMMKVILVDTERRVRQEKSSTDSVSLDDIIKWRLDDNDRPVPVDSCNKDNIWHKLAKVMSMSLMKIKHHCYDIKTDLVEVGAEHADMHYTSQCLYRCAVSVVNLFIIATMLLTAAFYQIDAMQNDRRAIDDWVETLVRKYK